MFGIGAKSPARADWTAITARAKPASCTDSAAVARSAKAASERYRSGMPISLDRHEPACVRAACRSSAVVARTTSVGAMNIRRTPLLCRPPAEYAVAHAGGIGVSLAPRS
ncbi:hypothetical protein ACFFX0_14655 [Citricoccus parietis]|uniref:Uncharacterized protein n=1 Tax=Citricoccus parietis TaxID=592307 RepID=A0ABV5G0B0_9MICC